MMRCSWLVASFLLLAPASFLSAEASAQATADLERQTPARCENGSAIGAPGCSAEEYLLQILASDGVDVAMAALDRLTAVDEDARRDAHSYAHAIGIAAYTGEKPVGEVFALCTPAYQSGCYHGVIQSFFLQQIEEEGGHLDASLVNALCRDHRENPEARWLLFQCAHGMGHGLVMLADRHLPTSLEGCDLVADPWERESCYGGVFMENVVHATVPHHAVGRPQEQEHEHGHEQALSTSEHDHASPLHGTEAVAEFPPLKADDPLYPCNALAERYLPACYQMQTSAILYFNGHDIAATAEACTKAPELFRATCFQSLGRDISAYTGQQHRRAIDYCAYTPDDLEPSCHIGYVKNLIDLTADPDDGFAYCRLLAGGPSKRGCYVAVGEQVWVLHDSVERRSALCGASESGYVQACRHGAGLERLSGASRVVPAVSDSPAE